MFSTTVSPVCGAVLDTVPTTLPDASTSSAWLPFTPRR